jgi:flagellar hook-length control protein FliK
MQIAPLRLDADGIHRLTVHLHPADLGLVSVVAEIRDGAVHVQLAGATDAGRESLRGALGDLRRELQESGFDRCSLDLRDSPPSGQQARQQFAGTRATGAAAPTHAAEAPAPPTTADGVIRRLDLHV